jgi:nudix-type nucleoside diphosphatase (YffH/AdpP family)
MSPDSKAPEGAHEIIHTRALYEGWTSFFLAKVRLADGHIVEREIEDHGEAACVLAYNARRKTAVLVRQLRAPALFADGAQHTLEAIAGIVEKNEDAAACARREAQEEAHLAIEALRHVFTAWTMPGISTERMHFFLAQYSGEVRPEVGGLPDEREDTFAGEFSLAELARMADAGELVDVKTLLLLQTLRLRQPELFEG